MAIKAFPIDKKGDRIGAVRKFSDSQWARLITIKPLRWKVAKNTEPTKAKELIKQKTVGIETDKNNAKTNKKKKRNRLTKTKNDE